MPNYLINSPSSETIGSISSDLFILRTIKGLTVFSWLGDDTVTAEPSLNGSAATLNAGVGNDQITLSSGGTFIG